MTALEHQNSCERATADDLGEEYKLITDPYDVNQILNRLGVNHDPDSIVLEDSYHAIFTKDDEYWGCHKATPLTSSTVYRIQ
jgi:hypothetical protein